MKRHLTLPLVVLCLAAFVQPLHAEHDFAPDRRDMHRLRALASDLEQAADDLDSAGSRGRRVRLDGRHDDHDRDRRGRGHDDDDRFVDAAERFAEDAEEFEKSVRRNMNEPEDTVDEFRDLRSSYRRLVDASRRIRLDSGDGRDFRRVQFLFSRISEYYEGPRRPQVDWRRVQILAHQVDDLADEIHDDARRDLSRYGGHHNSYRIREAIARFDHLREAARHFHRQVEHGRRDPEHIRNDFERLLAANDYANRYVWYLGYETRRDLQRLGSLLDQLDSHCYDGRHRRRHVDARPLGPIPVPSRPSARTVDFEDDWPQLLISLLGGDLNL